jgi:hypothetical protein
MKSLKSWKVCAAIASSFLLGALSFHPRAVRGSAQKDPQVMVFIHPVEMFYPDIDKAGATLFFNGTGVVGFSCVPTVRRTQAPSGIPSATCYVATRVNTLDLPR